MKSIFFSFLALLFLLLLSCDESEKFSSSSSLKLEYSSDTLGFDTVFTTIASPVQVLKIYNRNNNSISLSSIKLLNAESSGFRINVDGQAGTAFENIDLFKKDSIFIQVDIKANERQGQNTLIRDAIEISWNGNTKIIQLGAYSIDVDIWDDKTIDQDMHISAKKTYYIRGNVTINENTTVDIEEGTTLYFDQKGSLTVNGTLLAHGSSNKRITFRGHRFDFIQQNILYDNASGQWEGITIGGSSFDNEFTNVNIRNSRKGINFAESTPDKRKATLINTVIHNTSEYGIRATNCEVEAINCQFSNSAGSLINLSGGSYSFLHCTVVNYYQWSQRLEAAVVLLDNKFPFTKCHLTNSIIVGTFRDEVELLTNKNDKNILFSNCLIQSSSALNDDRFIETLWNIDAAFLFKELNSDGRFNYSFELTEDSKAIDAANVQFAQKAPTDLRGKSRLSDSKPDIGCYEWNGNE